MLAALRKAMGDNLLDCELIEVGCIGLCYAEPLVCIAQPGKPGICYGNVAPRKVVKLISEVIGGAPPVKDCLGTIGPDPIGRSFASAARQRLR